MFIKTKIDPLSKIRAYIDDALEEDTYVPADLAHRLVEKLRDEAPDLLAEWLNLQAVDLMRDTINRINQGRRSAVRSRSKASMFKEMIANVEKYGDRAPLRGWLDQQFPVGPENIRKPLGEMYREEILYASQMHERLAKGNAMQAAFLRAVANKVGAARAQDVWDNEKLDTLWASLS